MEIAKLQLASVSESKRINSQWRDIVVHMVARLTKISFTLSRYFRIVQVGSSVSGIASLYIRQPSSVPLRPD